MLQLGFAMSFDESMPKSTDKQCIAITNYNKNIYLKVHKNVFQASHSSVVSDCMTVMTTLKLIFSLAGECVNLISFILCLTVYAL